MSPIRLTAQQKKDRQEQRARTQAVKGWAFREDDPKVIAAIRAFLAGCGPCPAGHLSTYRLVRAQLGLTLDWYEAYADAVHAMGKNWPDVLTPEEERIANLHADDVAPRPEEDEQPIVKVIPPPPGDAVRHEYQPRDPDNGDWRCEQCGFGRHHPWHFGE
jgi:hypothetical protein